MMVLTRVAEQWFDEVADFLRQASETGSGRKFGAEDVAAQDFAVVGVRRASNRKSGQNYFLLTFQLRE
jgi:hypothetical protein